MAHIVVRPDDARIEALEGETVLAALARAGFRYRIGCRRGGCGVCKVQLVLGEVRYERPVAESVLSDDEQVEGVCLSCRAVPLTNVVIELQEGDKLRRVLPLGFLNRPAETAGPAPAPAQPPAQLQKSPSARHGKE